MWGFLCVFFALCHVTLSCSGLGSFCWRGFFHLRTVKHRHDSSSHTPSQTFMSDHKVRVMIVTEVHSISSHSVCKNPCHFWCPHTRLGITHLSDGIWLSAHLSTVILPQPISFSFSLTIISRFHFNQKYNTKHKPSYLNSGNVCLY